MAIHKVLILNGMTSVTDKDLSGIIIAFLNSAGGIVGTNDYLVQAQGTPNMTVQVATGRAWIPNGLGTMTYGTYLDSTTNVTIANNTSGQPRIDYIVLYVNLSASPDATGDNIPQLADVQGTPAASPVPPTPTQITTAIGASNPYLIIAQIGQSPTWIPNGVGSINSSMISSLRSFAFFTTGQVMPVPQYEEFTDQASAPSNPAAGKTRLFTIGSSLFLRQPTGPIIQIGSSSLVSNGNSGLTPTTDWTQGISQAYTLNGSGNPGTANTTFAFANPVAGEKLVLLLTQDTVGSRTVTWPSNVVWPNAVAPTLSTSAGNVDIVGFIYDSVAAKYRGMYQLGYAS